MGNLFSFIFLTFPSFSFIFFKTEKAIHRGGGEYFEKGTFSTGSWHEPVLKVTHEPVLMMPARLAVGTGTNGHISAGSIANRD